MVNVSKQDVDAACAAYANATGDYPRREGIRVALHSYRQMSDLDRQRCKEAIAELHAIGGHPWAETIERLLGLAHGE